jgi:hypothetical protein
MKTVNFYHKETGVLNGTHLLASDDGAVALNTPTDHIAIDGHHDHSSRRVDVATGELIDYQPPSPGVDYEWNADTKRWQLSAAVEAWQAARSTALAAITVLEGQGIRAMRELALGQVGAADRLAALDALIGAQRANL